MATTNALNVLTSAEVYGLSKVIHIVLDEADTLLDDSFFPELVGPFMNRFAVSKLLCNVYSDNFDVCNIFTSNSICLVE